MIAKYTEQDVKDLAEFLAKYQLEPDGSTKEIRTAMNEARERIEYEDFIVRPQNSVDGKEHIWTPSK